jgi:transglutaminase-like putative cysteine protease
MIPYTIVHTTRYRYSLPVPHCQNEAYLLPRSFDRQQCQTSQLQINPAPAMYQEREDFFGNRVAYFAVQEAHTVLQVTASSTLMLSPATLPALQASLPWEEVRQGLVHDRDPERLDARQFVLDSPLIGADPIFAEYAAPSFSQARCLLEAVHELMQRIYHDLTYDPDFTTVATPVHDVLHHRRGVCQDYAQLAIACVRSLGLPARYVSGYLESVSPSSQSGHADQASHADQSESAESAESVPLVGAAASHAWLSVYSPGQGWVDFDPTNNLMPTNQHITLAWGRDYSDVTPLKGVAFGGGTHKLDVAVEVRRTSLVK